MKRAVEAYLELRAQAHICIVYWIRMNACHWTFVCCSAAVYVITGIFTIVGHLRRACIFICGIEIRLLCPACLKRGFVSVCGCADGIFGHMAWRGSAVSLAVPGTFVYLLHWNARLHSSPTMHRLSAEARHVGVMSPTHYHSFERDGEMAGKGRRTLGRQNARRFRTKNPKEAEIKAVRKKQRSGLGEKEKHTRTRDDLDRGLFVPLSHTVLPSLSFPPPLFFSLIFLIPSLLYPRGLCSWSDGLTKAGCFLFNAKDTHELTRWKSSPALQMKTKYPLQIDSRMAEAETRGRGRGGSFFFGSFCCLPNLIEKAIDPFTFASFGRRPPDTGWLAHVSS